MIGQVVWFDIKKGWGFIRSDERDIFVHYSKIIGQDGEFKVLEKGDMVEFYTFLADRGGVEKEVQARDVKLLETRA